MAIGINCLLQFAQVLTEKIPQHQNIHFCTEVTVNCFIWIADDGFVLVETCVDENRDACDLVKYRFRINRLHHYCKRP